MLSPFEELEYVADFLPEEGESVVISRESGELVCQPHSLVDLRDGVEDAELYGRLIQMNDQLSLQNRLPYWLAAGSVCWGTAILYGIIGFSVWHWYLVPGLVFLSLGGALHWSQKRRDALFHRTVYPLLNRLLARRRMKPHVLLAGVSHHQELRTLHNELVRWMTERHFPAT